MHFQCDSNQYQNDYKMLEKIKLFINYSYEIKKIEFEKNKANFNSLTKTKKNIDYCIKIIENAHKNACSYKTALILDHKKRKNNNYKDKSEKINTFYRWISKIRELYELINKVDKKSQKELVDKIYNFLKIKTTGSKNKSYVYSLKQRKMIADLFYIGKYEKEIQSHFPLSKQQIYYEVRKDKYFEKISLSTIYKIITNDPRFIDKKIYEFKEHKSRSYDLDIGNIQLDAKIIGPVESPIKRRITIFDAIDEQSKLYFGKVLLHQTEKEVLNATCEMIAFFESHGIRVKRIRTDNAMQFKETNCLKKNGKFDKLLKSLDINHEFIPLKEPQCNGCIERQHRNLDDELLPLIKLKRAKTLKEFIYLYNWYIDYFNNRRSHKYYDGKLRIPIDYLKELILNKQDRLKIN